MSEKIWKIFGIFGMFCLAFLVFLFLFTRLSGKVRTSPVPTYTVGEKLFPLAPTSPGTLPEKGGTEAPFQTQAETPSRMIIKTGWLNLVVKDVLDTARKIAKFAEENGGWVVSSSISEHEKVPSGSITVRVPAEKFDEARDYFRSLAVRVTSERTQSQDITEEYVDLQSRLRNLEAAESQLLELMKRSGKISEILDVYRELTNIRQQIEQIKGRMQYLEQSVKMSSITINLALSEELLPIPPAEKWRPKYVLLQTWKGVLNFWKGFSYFLIRLIVWAQVWVPAVVIIYFGFRFWRKRKK
jgi:cell division protein FtsL